MIWTRWCHSAAALAGMMIWCAGAMAATCPLTFDTVLTAGQWQACFAGKQNTLGYVPVNKAGDVMTGRLVLPSPPGSRSGFNITPGSTPASPIDGDIWTETDGLYVRANGATVGPLGIGVTSGTSGGIPYFDTNSTQASSAMLTHYGVVYGGGTGGAPVATAAGAADQVFMGSATAPSFVSVGNCSSTSSALKYSTSTHTWGCNTFSPTATVASVGLSSTYGLTVGSTPVTSSGTITADLNVTSFTNSLSGNVLLNNVSAYFDGPTVAQGNGSGTWLATGTVTIRDTTAAASILCKLWDGTTVIASTNPTTPAASAYVSVSLSGQISNPQGNIRISCQDLTSTSGVMAANSSSAGKDSTVTTWRIR